LFFITKTQQNENYNILNEGTIGFMVKKRLIPPFQARVSFHGSKDKMYTLIK